MAYPVKDLIASPDTYTSGRQGHDIEYIFVHYTATGASAMNNCLYFHGGNRNSSAHYFLDGSGTIWRSVNDYDTAWSVGNFAMNLRSLSIEVVSAGEDFSAAEIDELHWLVCDLMEAYGVPAGRVGRHHDAVDFARGDGIDTGSWVDPHKACPAPYVDDAKWRALWEVITSPYGGEVSTPVEPQEPEAPSASLDVDGWWGEATTAALQRRYGTVEDGEVWHQWEPNAQPACTSGWQYDETQEGSPLIRAMQSDLGCALVDGILGPDTIAHMQARCGTVKDGALDGPSPCVAEMQRRLNAGSW